MLSIASSQHSNVYHTPPNRYPLTKTAPQAPSQVRYLSGTRHRPTRADIRERCRDKQMLALVTDYGRWRSCSFHHVSRVKMLETTGYCLSQIDTCHLFRLAQTCHMCCVPTVCAVKDNDIVCHSGNND